MSGYGRAESEWDELVDSGRNFPIERAKLGKLTSYTELNVTLANRTGCRPFDFERADERAAMGSPDGSFEDPGSAPTALRQSPRPSSPWRGNAENAP